MAELFRIKHQLSSHSLWYDANGNFDPQVHKLTDGKARDMPMGFDPDLGLGGIRWYSACESIPALSCVVSLADVMELEQVGYSLFRYEVTRFRTNDWHALFAKEDVLSEQKIDISLLKRSLMQGVAA